ncbi:uncharacterized protein L969DRAFT_88303 [Mixia osmundae IAM 14324]|uniref:Peptidase S28 n=1 Tax=Mixia osmundae (strain CBS 9802 / IAM 14324 / JCM 22182 / KY 12970) TaxID=764103 RepID=G7E773_MIXOS|nr:uncharacterized protein L969DRAFT_88303 [Mixia osmundae IAM 14324]KEI38932.1 hypothetical protein L969DRAFT_88303 [Mixia osmundae IAM 14324]GAA98683.1 hypothetical protein E5Q_05371 [Mixia osmundae IAM 14324]
MRHNAYALLALASYAAAAAITTDVPQISWVELPIDHKNPNAGTFKNRYWASDVHYKPGGPVLILNAGEQPATEVTELFKAGLLERLSRVSNGIAILFEHRFYGETILTKDLGTDSLRYLQMDQAIDDMELFARTYKHNGQDLSAPNTNWIILGLSYAGGLSTKARVLYPKTFRAAISSSAVVDAAIDNWQYTEALLNYGNQTCVRISQINSFVIDAIFDSDDAAVIQNMKTFFGLPYVQKPDEFAAAILDYAWAWQNHHWLPRANDPTYATWCNKLASTDGKYHAQDMTTAAGLIQKSGFLTSKWHQSETAESVQRGLLNFVAYLNSTIQPTGCDGKSDCPAGSAAALGVSDLKQTWRLWSFESCDKFANWISGHGPLDRLPVVPRHTDETFWVNGCPLMFPPGKEYTVKMPPDVAAANAFLGFDLGKDTDFIMTLVGDQDPWRPRQAPERPSTDLQPFITCKGCVHHWESQGLLPSEVGVVEIPAEIKRVQDLQDAHLLTWLKMWSSSK